jgi:hypothetical protein
MFHDPIVFTIVIGAESLGQGELYVDDGESFDFAAGAYVHRRFVFNGTVLGGIGVGAPTNTEFTKNYNAIIEQILVIGLEKAPIVVLNMKNKELRCVCNDPIFTMHKLQIQVNDDFTLIFKF